MRVREPSAKNVKKKKKNLWDENGHQTTKDEVAERGSAISVQRRLCDFQVILCEPLLKREARSSIFRSLVVD